MSLFTKLDQTQRDTLARLRDLRLTGFADGLMLQWDTPSVYIDMSFEDRLRDLIAQQEDVRRDARAAYLLKTSNIKRALEFEDILVNPDRGFTLKLKKELASLRFINSITNVMVQGASGAGKSSLIQALGRLCCRQGYSVKYSNANDLLSSSKNSDYSTKTKLRERLKRCKVLILDDLGLHPLGEELGLELFNLLEDREKVGPVIVGTQLRDQGLVKAIGGRRETIDAVMRRLTQGSIKVELRGDAYSMASVEHAINQNTTNKEEKNHD